MTSEKELLSLTEFMELMGIGRRKAMQYLQEGCPQMPRENSRQAIKIPRKLAIQWMSERCRRKR